MAKKETTRELVFYYPNPMWYHGDWVKTLILFFDGVALLVPAYMKDRPEEIDPSIIAGLKGHGLLQIIHPEKAVDKVATAKLAMALTDIIASGVLDHLAKEKTSEGERRQSFNSHAPHCALLDPRSPGANSETIRRNDER